EATAEFSEQGLRRRRIRQAERAGGASEHRQRPDEIGNRGDHGGEPGAKKRALGLEDYAQLPCELQREVETVVEQTKARSRWPAEQAGPGSRGAGPAAESALGHRSTAPADWRAVVLPGFVLGRILAVHRALRAADEHGWQFGELGGSAGRGDVAA